MTGFVSGRYWAPALAGVSAAAIAIASPAAGQVAARRFDIPAQPLSSALLSFSRQSDILVMATREATAGKRSNPVQGMMSADQAIAILLRGSGLRAIANDGGGYRIERDGASPQSGANRPTGAVDDDRGTDIIVTAQKRAEKIIDVPIAISVFSAKALDEQKIEGGSELLRGTPNVNFSKTNFASYNFAIRGIGTKALSVTTDPAVAISFNSMPMVRNRLFEQEYFDVERIEILRGPQGTLYGRNATAGVVNMIPVLAKPGTAEAMLKLEGGNFGSMRASGMVNIPLSETLAFRGAGAWTRRDGYDYNSVTRRRVNGRNLWSARGSLVWEPSDRLKISLVGEHFQERDDRSRTGKQLCHNDPSPAHIGDTVLRLPDRAYLSQGCKSGSLYDDAAFGVPNGASLPNVLAASAGTSFVGAIRNPDGSESVAFAIPFGTDPFSNVMQSRRLREIATTYDPRFRARNDILQLNLDFEIHDGLKLVSQTGWTRDRYWSTQDYGRFVSKPIFTDTSASNFISYGRDFFPGGVFTDPQLGSSSGYLAVDLNRAKSRQWSQEFRLQSSFEGRLNFNFGINYLDFKIDEDYFVFNNTFTIIGALLFNGASETVVRPDCNPGQTVPNESGTGTCLYIDPNPIDRINGDGHNYFRSRNVAHTKSYAGFGEIYWQATDQLKLTAGLRYTRDVKTTTPYPSQLLLTPGLFGGGYINSGYPAQPDIRQKWGEFTGRLVIDWKPDLGFTDDTLIYASYSRGYKAGGTNSPGIGADPQFLGFFKTDPRFRPEFVNAFEIGTKNSLANGRLILNATAFFYDYKDYQVSQIIDRATRNENFNAQTWGLELEAVWKPVPNFRINANLGLLGTKIGKGMKSIDVMDRLQGHDDWVVLKPFIQQSSNCVVPKALVEQFFNIQYEYQDPSIPTSNLGVTSLCPFPAALFGRPDLYGVNYDPFTYPDVGQNQGRGFYADLSGNELPNAPHWTFNIGAQYTLPLGGWDLTLRGDYYRQGASWARVYNAVNDRLKSWGNANLALTIERPDAGVAFQFYVKNLLNDTPITDAFINSDDSGLTTNVFTLDPRIFGLSISKRF